MLARQALRRNALYQSRVLLRPAASQQRRTYITEMLAPMANQVIDLSLALPWPADWPPYASTIILLALIQRTALLPIAMWSKNKLRITADVVLPELKKSAGQIREHVKSTPRVKGVSKEADVKLRREAYTELVLARQRELFNTFGCGMRNTLFIPVALNLATFIPMSLTMLAIAMPPTPLDSEAFLTLTALTHPDPSNILPVVIGIMNFANVDSHRWLMSPVRREEVRQREEAEANAAAAAGKPEKRLQFKPAAMWGFGMRFLSVARIVFAMYMPGSVLIYWTTSAAYGLFQSWVLEYWSSKRAPASLVVPPLNFKKLAAAPKLVDDYELVGKKMI